MTIELDVIDAAILYADALKENKAEIIVQLKDCKIFYVPNMPHSHRSVWTEANLFIYYASDSFDDDFLSVSSTSSGIKRAVFLRIVEDYNNLENVLKTEACNNLQSPPINMQTPKYIE